MTDYEQQLQLARERALRYGQQAQYQAPQGRMVGNIYVAPNPLEYLAAGLRSLGGMRGQQMAQEEITQIGGERNKAMADALRGFTEKAQGRPAEVLPPDVAGPARPAEAPNLMGAYEALMSAPDAGLRQMGMQGQLNVAQQQAEQQRKAQENQRLMSILQSSTPQQAIAAGVPVDLVKSYYESPNIGRQKVQFIKTPSGDMVPRTEFGDVPQNVSEIRNTGNVFSDLLIRDPVTGQIVPNEPLVGAKGRIAERGAARSNVTLNMPDKKFYEGLGTAISGQIEQGFTQAQSAVQTLNNANQIAQALDKAIVGPLANQRLALAQIGQVLGVGGKNNVEVLQNTRNVIQGLARQELSAAGQMKGQGQITESERAILRKAEAGQINEFTKPELNEFISAIRKTANYRIASHKRNIERLKNDPQAATILPYLQIDAPKNQENEMPPGFEVIR
jgi:hypothetical protein